MRATQHVALDASAGDRVSVSISCAVTAAELHSANKEDRRVVSYVAVQVGAPLCLNFDLESSKSMTPSFRRVVGAHELFCEGDENVDDPMPPAAIPTVLPLMRGLKRFAERVDQIPRQPNVEEVDHEEKRAPQGCRESSGGEKILEANRCAEEEVPAFPGLPDVEEESHEDKHALQGRRG